MGSRPLAFPGEAAQRYERSGLRIGARQAFFENEIPKLCRSEG